MLWKILTILEYQKAESSAQKLYTDVTINLRVGEKLEQFLSTSGVKQGDNLAPSSLSLSSRSIQHSDKKFPQPLTLDGFRTLKLEASREDNYAEPITQQRQCSRSSSPIMSTIRPSFFLSRGE
jgi:hypothetical protein